MQDKAAKPDYDQSLKRLLLRAHDGFLALVAPDLTWRGELAGILILLAGIRIPRTLISEVLRRQQMIDDILKESSFTEIMRDLLAPEYALKYAGMHARIALEGRFGAPLDPQILAALESAEEDVCEAILAHVTTDTLDDVRARLGIKSDS